MKTCCLLLVVASAVAPPVSASAAPPASSIALPRPQPLWQLGGVRLTEALATDGKLVFVVRKDFDGVAALDADTGTVRWQARLTDGKLPADRQFHRLQVAGSRLLYSDTKHLAAFSLPDGRRLWDRPGNNCRFFGSTEPQALLRCPGIPEARRFQLIAHADGREVRTFGGEPGPAAETAALGPSFVVIHDQGGKLRRLPLAGAAAGRSLPARPAATTCG